MTVTEYCHIDEYIKKRIEQEMSKYYGIEVHDIIGKECENCKNTKMDYEKYRVDSENITDLLIKENKQISKELEHTKFELCDTYEKLSKSKMEMDELREQFHLYVEECEKHKKVDILVVENPLLEINKVNCPYIKHFEVRLQEFTYELDVNISKIIRNSSLIYFGTNGNSGQHNAEIIINPDGQFRFYYCSFIDGNFVVEPNKSYHIVVTVSKKEHCLFIDGVKQTQYKPSPANPHYFYGEDNYSDIFFGQHSRFSCYNYDVDNFEITNFKFWKK